METASKASSTSTEQNRCHLFRMQMLIIDGGLLILRNIIDTKLQNSSLCISAFLQQKKFKITNLKLKGKIAQVQYDLLFPPSGSGPSTTDLDVTLIMFLLRNFKSFGLNKNFKWNSNPAQGDTSIEADMFRLTMYRNELSHISSTSGITPNVFTTKWTEIEQVLLRLNLAVTPIPDLQKIIDDFKAKPLDRDEEKRVQKAIDSWQKLEKEVETELKLIKEDTEDLKKSFESQNVTVESHTKSIDELNKKLCENGKKLQEQNLTLKRHAQDIDDLNKKKKLKKETSNDVTAETESMKQSQYEDLEKNVTAETESMKQSQYEDLEKTEAESMRQSKYEEWKKKKLTNMGVYRNQHRDLIFYNNEQEKVQISEWDRCITSGSESAAKKLLKRKVLPSQRELQNACRVFGMNSNILSEICSLISKHIKKTSENVIDVLPSYRNDHVLTNSYPSIHFVVVVKKDYRDSELKNDYQCFIKRENKYSSEGEIVVGKQMESDTCDMHSFDAILKEINKCINKNANDLTQKHSNLNVILPSVMKSVGYMSGKHEIKIEPCIALYVSVKGYIPLNETLFEKEIDGFPTDVLEGEFEQYKGGPNDYHEHLKIGVAIHANVYIGDKISGGTLGGFIEHPVYGFCGITSAHVVCDSDELARLRNAEQLSFKKTVYQPISEEQSAFGEVVMVVYNEGSESEPGMEVALISIKDRKPKDGSFPDTFNNYEAGFDASKPCFNSGKVVVDMSLLRTRTEVYKFGMTSGITRGSIASSGTIRVGNIFLKNQKEIIPIGDKPFAKQGDSGSLVLIQTTRDSAALGVVVGGMRGSTFVTPMCDILRAVGCKDEKMCEFTPPDLI